MSKTELTGPVPAGNDYRELGPGGQQRAYLVLSAEERARGFVRPVRRTYLHVGQNAVFSEGQHAAILLRVGPDACGTRTTMAQEIAETWARDPKFYGGTFCIGCGKHHDVGEFVWEGTTEVLGSDLPERPEP